MEDAKLRLPVVFVVDDEPVVLRAIGRAIRALPVTVALFAEPHAAVLECTRTRPDVLITDLRMPGMTGMELILLLRGPLPALRCILHTATPPIAVPTGVVVLQKPVMNDVLQKAVREALNGVLVASVSAL